MREESKKWLMQAEADLRAAENSLKSKDYHASVFWSQQAAEKCLKGLIIRNGGELIKIHDLVVLGKRAGITQELISKCEKLSKVYIESRYGILDEIPSQNFTKENSEYFLLVSKEVLEWVKKRI